MQNALYVMCDACGKIVQGKQGTADIKEPFISLRGSLCYQEFYDNSYHYFYGTQKGDLTFLHFCNGDCVDTYLSAKKELILNSKPKFGEVEGN